MSTTPDRELGVCSRCGDMLCSCCGRVTKDEFEEYISDALREIAGDPRRMLSLITDLATLSYYSGDKDGADLRGEAMASILQEIEDAFMSRNDGNQTTEVKQ